MLVKKRKKIKLVADIYVSSNLLGHEHTGAYSMTYIGDGIHAMILCWCHTSLFLLERHVKIDNVTNT